MGINASDFANIINSGAAEQNVSEPAVSITPQSIYEIANSAQPESQDWSKVATRAITNIPESGVQFGKNIYQAVRHPIQTAGGVLDLAAGTLHNILPEHVAEWIDKADYHPEASKRAVETANAVGHILKNRYGSSENFKETLASDPVGVASDVASLMAGGEGLALKGGLTKTADVLSKANPISAAGRAVEAVGKPLLSMTTGVGAENIANAAKAGYTGDKSFYSHLTGNAPINEPLQLAKANLDTMKANRSNAYRNGMVNISNDKSILDFKDIDKALNDTKKSISFKGQHGAEVPTKVHQELSNMIDDWKNLDPVEYHTPEGLDFLKKKIGDYTQGIGYEHANANRVGSDIYNAVKGTISKQAPKYAEVMGDYHNASESIQEIEKALSLGNRASADTAIRKLQSLTRNNANTNYGQRLTLAQKLEQEGGRPFINALSGQALSSPTARGLSGVLESGSILAGATNPALWATIPVQTPKLVGATLYGGGKLAKKLSNVGATPQKANALADFLQYENKSKE